MSIYPYVFVKDSYLKRRFPTIKIRRLFALKLKDASGTYYVSECQMVDDRPGYMVSAEKKNQCRKDPALASFPRTCATIIETNIAYPILIIMVGREIENGVHYYVLTPKESIRRS